jgi:hypothetical protein
MLQLESIVDLDDVMLPVIRLGVIVVSVVVVVVLPASVAGQSAGAAAITGIVRDMSGARLQGALVEAASPALIEKARSTRTDERGEYRLTELRAGVYTLSIALTGFTQVSRAGVELGPGFTATIDVELDVQGAAETITVASTTRMDLQALTQATVLSSVQLEALPTAKTILGMVALMPAAIEPPNAQDVGGSKGERSVRISAHGGKTSDSRHLQDGMRYNVLTPGLGTLEGAGRGYYINPLAAQAIVIDLGTMGSAEYSLGGVQLNTIPRDGGNTLRGSLFAAGTGHGLQSNNLTDDLRARGLTSVNTVRQIHDVNGALGGSIVRDRIWFFAAAREWGATTGAANLYADANRTDFLYTPDMTRPIRPDEAYWALGGRLTTQATTKDKVTFSYDRQKNFQDQLIGQLETGVTKSEANASTCQQHAVTQATWTRPQSNRLLFDAGFTISRFDFGGFGDDLFLRDYEPCGAGIAYNHVSIADAGLGFSYNGVGSRTHGKSHQSNGRLNLSKVAAGHYLKAGLFWMYGLGGGHRSYTERAPAQIAGLPLAYTFTNATPTGLTQFASPTLTIDQLNPDLGVYLQDQWRLARVTINAGLRFDWVRETVKATSVPAGVLVPPREYPAQQDVPNWKDVSPRLGIAWTPFADAKTVVKAGLNRYVQSNTTGVAQLFDRAATAVNNTTRSWADTNGNWLPDCDLKSTGGNGECGPMANVNFGTYVPINHPDSDWITGWGRRGYNWQTSLTIEREVLPTLTVSAGYSRTWYGNFMVSDNLNVTPADYSPYCVTVPNDQRLPNSGQELCGLYDINPDKFGQVNNRITLASHYGEQKETYNGVDLGFQWRLPGTAEVGGGWNLGNAVQLATTAGGSVSSSTRNCFVIDSPQQLFNCAIDVPYQSRLKVNGSYLLPHGVQIATVIQSLPGATYNATRVYTAAEIQPSLGRPLAGGVRAVLIPLVPPFSLFGPRITQVDVRASKIFRGVRQRIQAHLDVYNLLNGSAPLNTNGTYNATWQQPTQILDGRLVKFSIQYDF